ncbi:MAG: ArsR/SmtB family transcription factor [Beijerinckiaceae bacterium]
MSTGPNIAAVAALIADPARALMLGALMQGKALTAGELAREAGVTASTASSHLARLVDGGLLGVRVQGRHRYFALQDAQVAALLESMMRFSATRSADARRTGPRDPAMQAARVCYDHLAGERGVALYDGLLRTQCLHERDGAVALTPTGEQFIGDFGIDLRALRAKKRPLCRACLDWSARRSHLGGALGAAILARMESLHWLRRARDSRIVTFSPLGERKFRAVFEN